MQIQSYQIHNVLDFYIIGGTQMQIQSYQIHNVLDFYRKQLSQGKLERPIQTGGGDTAKDSVYISPEGKSQAIMEKVTDSVLKKITNVKPESVPGDGTLQSPLPNGGGANSARYDNRFVFKTIAGNNQLETRSIAVDDSQMLVRRLDEQAKGAFSRRTE